MQRSVSMVKVSFKSCDSSVSINTYNVCHCEEAAGEVEIRGDGDSTVVSRDTDANHRDQNGGYSQAQPMIARA